MFGFSSGISALSAARLAIQTVGNNLANATTPGYSRERVVTQTGTPTLVGRFYQGGGVRVASLDRITDDLLLGRVRGQTHEVARRDIALQTFLGVEAAFGEPSDSALSGQLTNFFSSLSSLATSPDDSVQKRSVIFGGSDIAQQLQRVHSDLTDTQLSVEGFIEAAVDKVNSLAETIAQVNEEISGTIGSTGEPPPALLDRQGQLLDELSRYVDISVADVGAGRVDVRVGGQVIVSGASSSELQAGRNEKGEAAVFVEGSPYEVDVASGELRGYIDLSRSGVQERINELDEMASALILNFNRIHSTGVPEGGGFTSLLSQNPVLDTNNNGLLGDSLLRDAGLPFPIQSGRLWVSVLDDNSGAVTQTSIDIDPAGDTVDSLIGKLSAIDGMTASLDATGRISINAQGGKRFHFGATLDPNPDAAGTFGSSSGQIAGTASGPFALTAGDTLSIAVDGGAPQPVTFNAGSFANIGAATPNEIAAAIQGSLVGATASVVDGRVVVTSNTTGASSQIQITDGAGSPAAALGLSTAADFGAAQSVSVAVSGEYSGQEDDSLTFVPTGSGTIGLTPGLQIQALDSNGQVVALLDVGQGYSPGDDLDVGNGIKVSFGPGDINQASGDFATLPLITDSDDTDVLAAFGLNAFFVGNDATNIEVAGSLKEDAGGFALALSGAVSDNRNVMRMLSLRDGALTELGGQSAEEFYNGVVAEVGKQTSRAQLSLETETLLMESFENRLESVRGVSIDEELADLQRYEQAYQAAARYIAAVNDMSQILYNL